MCFRTENLGAVMSRWRTFVGQLVLYIIFTGALLAFTALGVFLFITHADLSYFGSRNPTFFEAFPLALLIEGLTIALVGSMGNLPSRGKRQDRVTEKTIGWSHVIFGRSSFSRRFPSKYDWLLIYVGITLIVAALCLMVAWNI